MMSTYAFAAAAFVVGVTFLVHVFVGGRLYIRALLASDIAPNLKWMAYMTWHVGSVAFLVIGAGFAAAAASPDLNVLALGASVLAGSFALVAMATAIKGRMPFTRFPVIPLFGLAALLGAIGLFAPI